MAISGISDGTTTNPNGTPAGPQSALDKDAFLKLLVAQLQHQDPLKPMEGTEFVTQLAQFTAVEQGAAQTAKLDLISMQMSGLASNEAASLVGKQVTIRGQGGLTFDGVLSPQGSASLTGPAKDVKVDVIDANGTVVDTIELHDRPAGALNFAWDGKNAQGNTLPAGQYTTKISATDADGKPVDVASEVSGIVVKVTYENGYPEVVLDNGVKAPVSDLVSVGLAPTATPTTSSNSNTNTYSNIVSPDLAAAAASQTGPSLSEFLSALGR
jgi:flagellar basal-body rod modification protein FlgD